MVLVIFSSSQCLKAIFLGMDNNTKMGLSLRGLKAPRKFTRPFFSDFLNWGSRLGNDSVMKPRHIILLEIIS
jgi:hypothetical protein